MKIEKNKVVLMHYTLKNDNGEVLDSSSGKDPLGFIHGAGMIIPGLEQVLIGKQKDDNFMAVIPPEDAYGEKRDELVQDVPLSQFENKESVQVGMQFQVSLPQPAVATVIAISDETATVDFNHPLAGQELYFDVSIFDVRDASPEELANSQPAASNSCSLPSESEGESCGCC